MKKISIQNISANKPTSIIAIFCESFMCRLRGLMFRSNLAIDEGLLLVQHRDSRLDSAIHMLFVPMDLGVIWINSDFLVVDIQLAHSWHMIYIPKFKARYILEIHPERICDFQIGDKIIIN